jgi:hypothetical protein
MGEKNRLAVPVGAIPPRHRTAIRRGHMVVILHAIAAFAGKGKNKSKKIGSRLWHGLRDIPTHRAAPAQFRPARARARTHANFAIFR